MTPINDTFDYWENGVPVIVPRGQSGDFSYWDNGVPFVDVNIQPVQERRRVMIF